MSVSLNGWPVIIPGDKSLVSKRVPGTQVFLKGRSDVLPLFLAIAADYAQHVAPLRRGECGLWAYRSARQAAAWSDHASATAVDLNWGHEGAPGPHGGMITMTAAQVKGCADIAKFYGIVLWGGASTRGGAYHDPGSWDPMHFALRPGVTLGDVRATLLRLGIGPDGVRATRPKK